MSSDVIQLTFDGHQGGRLDRSHIERLASPLHVVLRQVMFDEDSLECFQIIICGQIHHGQIFIVKCAMFFSTVTIACNQVSKELKMRTEMIIQIHRHKAGQLQKSGVDTLTHTLVTQRNRSDDIFLEPVQTLFGSILIDLGRAQAYQSARPSK